MEKDGKSKSPCLQCNRVKDPEDCENKNCKQWRAWWSGQWDGLCRDLKQVYANQSHTVPAPVKVGGFQYAIPHQVREYVAKDPCQSCVLTRDLCTSPCPARRTWDEAREEMQRGLESRSGGKATAL